MSYAQENGYTPVSFAVIMDTIRVNINTQFGTAFTNDSFVGSNWYKYFYTLVQRELENETKASEIFAKLQQYIGTTNDRIQRPSVSLPGIIDSFKDAGYTASVKRNVIGDAGTISIALDVDSAAANYDAVKTEIATLIKDFVAGGLVSQGTEEVELTLTNGQQFTFSFYLPTASPVLLRLTLTPSDNIVATIPSDEIIRTTVFNNINERYKLGWDFEPQRYYTQVDAPWAASILLEWSDNNGVTWHDEVFEAEFIDLFTFGLEDIAVVVNP